jgi:HlyD family secretion protein
VIGISPRPNEEEGNSIVTYEVTVAIETLKESPGFLSGMTATANIETERLEDVVVIPNRAVKIERSDGQPVIYVEKLGEGDEVMRVEVELGLRDETTTEVITGLEEGDQVIIRRQVEVELQPGL